CYISFFFQAEDGIRDYKVTGVQTCALPILASSVCLYVGRTGAFPLPIMPPSSSACPTPRTWQGTATKVARAVPRALCVNRHFSARSLPCDFSRRRRSHLTTRQYEGV